MNGSSDAEFPVVCDFYNSNEMNVVDRSDDFLAASSCKERRRAPPVVGELALRRLHFQPDELAVYAADDVKTSGLPKRTNEPCWVL
jgi:hypothetical protein